MPVTAPVRSYQQYCPVSRASEVLGARWTFVVIRNVLMGCRTFTEIAKGAPGMSRGLLSSRLAELTAAGILRQGDNPSGRGSVWELSEMGEDLVPVIMALGTWGARWLELQPVHADPGVVLWSWCTDYLDREALPEERTVVRFDFPEQPPERRRYWILAEHHDAELCTRPPDPEEHLVVRTDAMTIARWHLGEVEWASAVDGGAVEVLGPSALARSLPRWNRRSRFADVAAERIG